VTRQPMRLPAGLALAVLAAIWVGTPHGRLWAQRPATAGGPTITLRDAVDRTLRYEVSILQAREEIDKRQGSLWQASGLFDPTFFWNTSFSFVQEELVGRRLQFEVDRRLRFEFAALALDTAADAIIRGLPNRGTLLFQCSPEQSQVRLTIDGTDIILCLNFQGDVEDFVFPETSLAGFNVAKFLLIQLDGKLDPAINALLKDYVNFYNDILRLLARQFRIAASALRIGRERLGPIPEDEQFLDLGLDLGHQLRFRNGMALTSTLSLLGTEDNFAGKPLQPLFGDTVFPNEFITSVGVRLDLPLGKGRGRVATQAPERAAEASLRAARHLLAHTATQQALETVLAYWDLRSVQERLRFLEASAEIQGQVLEGTRVLVDADELAAAELYRIEARHAEVLSQVAAERQAVVRARLGLQTVMGLSAERLDDAPLAADPLPQEDTEPAAGDPQAWVDQANAQRLDLAAAAETARASEILAQAAKVNLRRQVDLSLNTSFGGLHESFVERLYDPSAYWKALSGRLSGPSYGISLRFALPFRNREARGQLQQATASQAQSEIVATDLKRLIRLRILEILASLERAGAELQRARETAGHQQETLNASLERYEAGEITLIDTLTTEQQLTGARLAVVDASREVASLRAELQFEAGQLLAYDGEGDGEDERYGEELDPSRARLAPLTPPTL
jgi:outer membrane protein TolC